MARVGLILGLSAITACSKSPPAPPVPVPAPDGAPPPAPPPAPRILAPVRLSFVGDINLGTLTIPDGVPPEEGRGLLRAAQDALQGDLVVGNFEGVLGDSGTTYKCGRKGKHVTLADTAAPKREPVAPKRRAATPPKTKPGARPPAPRMCVTPS